MNHEPCEFEWDGIVNDPERKAEADKRAAEQVASDKKEMFVNFYYEEAKRRKGRTTIQAIRYTVAALATAAVAWFVGAGGIVWLACALGAIAVSLGLIASYGFGCAKEM